MDPTTAACSAKNHRRGSWGNPAASDALGNDFFKLGPLGALCNQDGGFFFRNNGGETEKSRTFRKAIRSEDFHVPGSRRHFVTGANPTSKKCFLVASWFLTNSSPGDSLKTALVMIDDDLVDFKVPCP